MENKKRIILPNYDVGCRECGVLITTNNVGYEDFGRYECKKCISEFSKKIEEQRKNNKLNIL